MVISRLVEKPAGQVSRRPAGVFGFCSYQREGEQSASGNKRFSKNEIYDIYGMPLPP